MIIKPEDTLECITVPIVVVSTAIISTPGTFEHFGHSLLFRYRLAVNFAAITLNNSYKNFSAYPLRCWNVMHFLFHSTLYTFWLFFAIFCYFTWFRTPDCIVIFHPHDANYHPSELVCEFGNTLYIFRKMYKRIVRIIYNDLDAYCHPSEFVVKFDNNLYIFRIMYKWILSNQLSGALSNSIIIISNRLVLCSASF